MSAEQTREQIAEVLAEHEVVEAAAKAMTGLTGEYWEATMPHRKDAARTRAGRALAAAAPALAAALPDPEQAVRDARAAAWDEGQAAVNADWMRGYDAQTSGEPCPDPTPNPYREARP